VVHEAPQWNSVGGERHALPHRYAVRRSTLVLLYGLVFFLLLPVRALEILDLPETPDAAYDLRWSMPLSPEPFTLALDGDGRTTGYRVTIQGRAVTVAQGTTTLASSTLPDTALAACAFSLKRRAETLAILCQHRLVLSTPLPSGPSPLVTVLASPRVCTGELRYQPVEAPTFGDDFMRAAPALADPEAIVTWQDPVWAQTLSCADFTGHPAPAGATDPPWALSYYPDPLATTNGFWLQYGGAGPAAVLSHPGLTYSCWDRYFLEAAVRPDYDSVVGLLAAYQDPQNYLLFRWHPHDAPGPHAELLAMIDGHPQTLATGATGFFPEQWATVRLTLGWHRVAVWANEQLLLDAANPGPIEGRVGLYADGALHPQRPALDDATCTMYVLKDPVTGIEHNEATQGLRTTTSLYFDDVRVGPWEAVMDDGHTYRRDTTAPWDDTIPGELRAPTPARLTLALPVTRATADTAVWLPPGGQVALLGGLTADGSGYAWVLTPTAQTLVPIVKGVWGDPVDRCPRGLPAETWTPVQLVVDGPYLAGLVQGERVLDVYDPHLAAGQVGIEARTAGVRVHPLTLDTAPAPRYRPVYIHPSFITNTWISTWAAADADWYPALPPTVLPIPPGQTYQLVAAPAPTNTPGLYWHKGGHYHDLRVRIPLTPETCAGALLHLSRDYQPTGGYRVKVTRAGARGIVTLVRQTRIVGTYPFPLTPAMRLVVERLGAYLIGTLETLDPAAPVADADADAVHPLFVYRDPQPLPATQVGFTVTNGTLPAAAVSVASDRRVDAFETAPAGWTTQSGVWRVMARYSCQPQWNWFGGFGAETPTAWHNTRLDGDQVVEGYFGVKMLYDNVQEDYFNRYRDLNLTICADGAHLTSGYTVLRGGRAETGERFTALLRGTEIVASSREPRDLFPSEWRGHRQWFATRIEKEGATLRVYIDNHRTFTYTDPHPLPGGYVACWTLNNGMMIGRVNLSAEHLTPGAPQAAAPAALQETWPALPPPALTLNGTAVRLSTFETSLDGWAARPGMSGRLVRVRADDRAELQVINSYPAGDLGVTVATDVNLTVTPIFTTAYAFDPGVQVSLYCRLANRWYAFPLTGSAAASPAIYVGPAQPAVADGQWRRLTIDLQTLLLPLVQQRLGRPAEDAVVQEVVIADWGGPALQRQYGFGRNPGGATLRFAAAAWLPKVTRPLTLAGTPSTWRGALSPAPNTLPATDAPTAHLMTGTRDALNLHLAGTAEGVTSLLHLPLPTLLITHE